MSIQLIKNYEKEEAFLVIDNQLIYQLFLNLLMFLHENHLRLVIDLSYVIHPMEVKFIVNAQIPFSSNADINKIATFFESTNQPILYPRELYLHLFKKLVNQIEGKLQVTVSGDNTLQIAFTVPGQTRTLVSEIQSQTLSTLDKTILSDKHILIVEDINYNRMLLKEYLADTGAILHFASNGKEAIEICQQLPYADIILLDIQLPDVNGYELISDLKKICPDSIIIAQTAYNSVYDKKRALELGFTYYLSKPLKQDALIETLSHAVQKHMN
jgi:CheY-like chemotaxis protein